LPGVNREVARVLRGGSLAPPSALALRTDGEAVAALGDPRFPGGSVAASAMPGLLDRELRGVAVRGLQPLADHLIRTQGYVRGNPDDPADTDYPENPAGLRRDRLQTGSLFVLYYDWRRDVAENACVLGERLMRIRAATGAERVFLVGHSLGGVVARYYLRHGGRDAVSGRACPLGEPATREALNRPGASVTAGAVFLGAPHRGSAQAFRALLEDFNILGVLGLGLRDAVVTMPMAWALLPFPDGDGSVPLLVGQNGDERVALLALRTWAERRWLDIGPREASRLAFVEAMLARAAGFQARMSERSAAEDAVRRLNVAAECRPTLARAIVADGKLEFVGWEQSHHPLYPRATAPGDGVVTAESALALPPAPSLATVATCSRHSGYLDDPAMLERVAGFLVR
jgi:pimeloyl-ACP methyl ester carboxylesterase